MRGRSGSSARSRLQGIVILHEDRDLLVIDKPPGLLTMGTDTDKSHTAYFILTDYVRKGYAKSRKRLFIVHRLDRDTSGVLLFAKTAEAKHRLQEHWGETAKQYLAVVHGQLEKSSDTITSYLAENRAQVVYSTRDRTRGRLARTAYRVVKQSADFTLLELDLLTGRRNQIRVHLADLGHPVVGDRKYGHPDRTYPRLALHARSIAFTHPHTGQPLTIESAVPAYFERLMGRVRHA
jgi:tRNA pseudouridine32 synthase/23S rRNA pseudouridine746 synthase/23S rRNA pseudouridine1911/1915/1917 synthase